MLGGGLQLALIPAPLVAAAIIVFGLSPRRAGAARLVAAVGIAATVALLALEAAFLDGSGRIEASLGTPVGGIDYLLRLDLPGSVLGLAATTAGLLLLVDPNRQTREVSALLVCVIGSTVAVLAGNIVMLTGGVEIAGVGMLLMVSAARGRAGRGGLVAIGLVHLASLGLVVAAVQLLSSVGTTDFAVIPAGAMGATVAGPWAAAGVMRLLAPAFVPIRGARTSTAAWATTGAIPCGAIVLLRLREVAAGPLPEEIAVALAGLGGLAALIAAVVALRRTGVPVIAGRALCVIAAAPVVALTGMAGPAAGAAVSAGICSLMLVTALTPAWEPVGKGRTGTVLAAFALAAAGSLPVGFGITALILELAATVSIGRAGGALVAALGLATALGAAAAVQTVSRVVAMRGEGTEPGPRPSALAGVAALASLVAGVVPGATATVVLAALSGGALTETIGAAAIRSNAGDWSGGYVVVACVVVAAGIWAFATLAGLTLAGSRLPGGEPVHLDARTIGLRQARGARPFVAKVTSWLDQLDDWLVVQPQLLLVIGGAVLGLLLIHS